MFPNTEAEATERPRKDTRRSQTPRQQVYLRQTVQNTQDRRGKVQGNVFCDPIYCLHQPCILTPVLRGKSLFLKLIPYSMHRIE